MKKFLFLSLLGLPVLFLWGCSLINNNDSWINTWDVEKISQLEQQLSWLLEQFSWLQAENDNLTVDNNIASNNTTTTNTTSKEIWLMKQIYIDQNWNRKLEIDYIQLWWSDECGWGVSCIINQNPQLRTFTISNNVEIIMQTLSHTSDGSFNNNQSISFNYFKQKFNDTTQYNNYPHNYSNYMKAIPYQITIENNIITKIEEQYMS